MELLLKKVDGYPVYRQIVDQIAEMVKNQELLPGERLPTERELSISTSISRGTIKRAYDELSSEGIIERVQGSGSFVAKMGFSHSGRQGQALEIIGEMLDDLAAVHLSYKEMESLIGSKIQWRRLSTSNVRIAVVDCNMETLDLISGQLYKLSDVDVSEMIIIDLEKAPHRLTYGYDLILTTKNHYLQVIELAPTVADKVIKVEIAPSRRLLYELAKMGDGTAVGIWCMSQEFANAVFEHVVDLGRKNIQVDYHLDCEPGRMQDFIKGKDLLILPYDYLGSGGAEDVAVMKQYQEEGGQIIYFEYHIDRGSLIHVLHEIDKVRHSKRRSAN